MRKPKKWDLMTPEEQGAWREKDRACNKAYRQTPERKAYQKAYNKEHKQTPERKAQQKAYSQTPAFKAQQKAYSQTPEGKARKKAYQQTPEYKAYDKARNQNRTKQSTARNYMTALFAAQQFIQAIETKPENTP